MKTAFTLLACVTAFTAGAQGINFEAGNWQSVLDKAKKEHKLVYVDVYTTWCGPCKILAAQVFPKKEAGDKFNKLFVNYRIDAEKGEGIALAKNYEVNGYPTHLFIDPSSKKVVYRDMGATTDVAEFNKHADVALQEQADPMTLEKYAAKFNSGEKSEAFLRAFLNKSDRLHQPNDAILDRYVDVISAKPVADSNIEFLLDKIQTTNTRAVPYVFKYSGDIAVRKQITGAQERFSRWSYSSFEDAVKAKDIAMLDSLRARTVRYTGKDDQSTDYWYRTQYFTKIGDESGALKAGIAEAEFLSGKPDSYYTAEDEKSAANGLASLRWQLKAMNVDSSRMEELVALNVKQHPSIIHSVSLSTAMKLNELSWKIYESHGKDQDLLSKALGWSKRSLDLTSGMTGWSSNADTYAHLLWASGKKGEAIKLQEEAVAKAGEDERSSLKESLEQMKGGTL
jgi:thiol-disulfide isomerase/thioredoxin